MNPKQPRSEPTIRHPLNSRTDMEAASALDVHVTRLKATAMELLQCQELLRAEENGLHVCEAFVEQSRDAELRQLVQRAAAGHRQRLTRLQGRLETLRSV